MTHTKRGKIVEYCYGNQKEKHVKRVEELAWLNAARILGEED